MGGLFSTDVPKPPRPKPPAPMPDEESPLVLEAGRQEAMARIGSSGRRSTILSAPFAKGPGANQNSFDTYSRGKLGA
jgi:hypothetical protein